MLARLSFVLFAGALLGGCAGAEPSPMAPRELGRLPDRPRANDESFWDAHAWSEAQRPAPERPRSISLGYIGDRPLDDGMTRDSPPRRRRALDPRAPMGWWDYVNAPSWTPQPRLPATLAAPPVRLETRQIVRETDGDWPPPP